MKLLVTGICGRLGRALAAEGPAQGHSLIGLDVIPWPENKGPRPQGVELMEGSYEDFVLMEKLVPGCDALIHTAGLHGGNVKTHTLPQFIHSNVECVARLLEIAVKAGVRRVALSSTMEVLLGRDWGTSGAVVVDEECPPRCDSAYSISRLLVEQLAREFTRKHPISIACLRYMAFGYGPDSKLGPSLIARSVGTRDTARSCLAAVSRDGLMGDVFHVGPKTPITNRDVIQAFSDPVSVLEKHWPGAGTILEAQGHKIGSSHFWPATSIRKARLVLGWEPELTFEGWLLNNGWKKP